MEDRALYEVLVPEVEEKFVIDNDEKAEWALTVIKAEKQERDRLIAVCEEKIHEYQQKIEDFKRKYENSTAHLISALNQYFHTVPRKKTKTQETYQLPSGKLKLKLPSIDFQRDDEKLIQWLDKNLASYVKVKKSPDWAGLKKIIQVAGDKVVTLDGEVIEGVTAVEKPASFEIDV